jgi:hypothetical protein
MSRLFCAMAVLMALAPAGRGDTLDRGLLDHADRLIDACVKSGHKTFGVVKFRVSVPGGPSGYREPLSSSMADRVENLLIACDEKERIGGVIRGLGAQVTLRVKEAKRADLFRSQCKLAWGKGKAKPDAVISGRLVFSTGLKDVNVEVEATNAADETTKLVSFKVAAGRDLLADAGLCFSVPDPSLSPAELDEKARKACRESVKIDPTDSTAGPAQVVTVEAFRDGKGLRKSKGYYGSGVFETPEAEGKLSFKLTNTGKRQAGLVLRVAGRGTIEKEVEQLTLCRKILLGPGKSVTLAGHLSIDTEGRQVFKMMTAEGLSRAAPSFGPQLDGLIELAVFITAEKEEKPDPDSLRGFGIDGLNTGPKWTREDLRTELRVRAGLKVTKVAVRASRRPDVPAGEMPHLEGSWMKSPRLVEYQRLTLERRP